MFNRIRRDVFVRWTAGGDAEQRRRFHRTTKFTFDPVYLASRLCLARWPTHNVGHVILYVLRRLVCEIEERLWGLQRENGITYSFFSFGSIECGAALVLRLCDLFTVSFDSFTWCLISTISHLSISCYKASVSHYSHPSWESQHRALLPVACWTKV